MTRKLGMLGAIGAGLLIVLGGCEKSEDTTPTAPPPPQSPKPAPQATGTEVPGVGGVAAADATAAAKSAATDVSAALEAQKAAAQTAAQTAAAAAAQTAAATPIPPAVGTPATAPAASDSQAQKLLDQAMTYIKENKYDLAEKSLTQIEGMKASLSPAMQKSVDQARTMLNTAKGGNALKDVALPSLGGK